MTVQLDPLLGRVVSAVFLLYFGNAVRNKYSFTVKAVDFRIAADRDRDAILDIFKIIIQFFLRTGEFYIYR